MREQGRGIDRIRREAVKQVVEGGHPALDESSTGKRRIYHWSRENLPLVNSPFTTGEFSFYHW